MRGHSRGRAELFVAHVVRHEPARFALFARRYRSELKEEPARMTRTHLRSLRRARGLVFVTATKDLELLGARVLRDVLI